MALSHIAQMLLRFNSGGRQISSGIRVRTLRYILSCQSGSGGFSHSDGGSADLFSTYCGIRALMTLGELDEKTSSKVADYLKDCLIRLQMGDKRIVTEKKNPTGLLGLELCAMIFSCGLIEAITGRDIFAEAGIDRREYITKGFHALRRNDGGLASSVKVEHTSTYHSMLGAICFQIAGIPLKEYDPAVPGLLETFLGKRQLAGGGFVELELIPTIGTVATSSAVNIADVLHIEQENYGDWKSIEKRQVDGNSFFDTDAALAFIQRMHVPGGGYRAISRIPSPTLFATYMAISAIGILTNWQRDQFPERELTFRFVESLRKNDGGFSGASFDSQSDLESTFYALAVMSMLLSV